MPDRSYSWCQLLVSKEIHQGGSWAFRESDKIYLLRTVANDFIGRRSPKERSQVREVTETTGFAVVAEMPARNQTIYRHRKIALCIKFTGNPLDSPFFPAMSGNKLYTTASALTFICDVLRVYITLAYPTEQRNKIGEAFMSRFWSPKCSHVGVPSPVALTISSPEQI